MRKNIAKIMIVVMSIALFSIIVMMLFFEGNSNSIVIENINNNQNADFSIINEELQEEVESPVVIVEEDQTPEITPEIETIVRVEQDNQAEVSNSYNLVTKLSLVDWGFRTGRNSSIDTVIIHSSYDAIGADPYSFTGLLREYEEYGVAPHYLIDRKGVIFQLVQESNTAYHAGVAKLPNGATNVNERSIGIELMNTEVDKITKDQYKALEELFADLKSRYKIAYIKGHSDVAPGRKTDPWGFDWSKFGG